MSKYGFNHLVLGYNSHYLKPYLQNSALFPGEGDVVFLYGVIYLEGIRREDRVHSQLFSAAFQLLMALIVAKNDAVSTLIHAFSIRKPQFCLCQIFSTFPKIELETLENFSSILLKYTRI